MRDRGLLHVNGNVLIPLLEERTPLATNPATRAIIQTLLDAYPNVPLNHRDVPSKAQKFSR